MDSKLKNLSFVGFWLMCIMLVLHIVWFKQRAFLLDFSHIAHLIIQKGSFAIQENRYGSFITHLFPMLALKAGWGLKSILWVYNLSFFTFFTGVYAILHFRLKQYDIGLLILAYFTVFVGDVFFWSNNEVHQGVCWAFLGIGILNYYKSRGRLNAANISLSFIFIILGLFSHLLVVVPVLFYWLFSQLWTWGEQKKFRFDIKDIFWWGVLLIIVAVLSRYFMSHQTNYDNEKLANIRHLKFATAFQAFVSEHAKGFYKIAFGRYPFAMFLMTGSVLFLAFRKKWLPLLLFLLTVACYWMLINLTYPQYTPRSLYFYMESEYMVAAIVLALPLLYLLKSHHYKPQVQYLLLSILVMLTGFRIGSGYLMFNGRVQNLEAMVQYCEEKSISKALVAYTDEESKAYFVMDWGLPVSTLFYSNIYKERPVTIKGIRPDKIEHFRLENTSGLFYESFGESRASSFNRKLLKVDTGKDYQLLDKADLFRRLKVVTAE